MDEQSSGKPSESGESKQSNIAVEEEIERNVRDLLLEGESTWDEKIAALGKYGEKAAEVLVSALLRETGINEASEIITEALEEMGKNSVAVLINAFARIGEIRSARDVYLTEMLAETLWRIRDRRATPALIEQVAKFERTIKRNGNKNLVELCESAKSRLQLILIDMGVKEGVDELMTTLGDGRKRVREGVVEALEKVGDKRALVPLIRLHGIERNVSDWNVRQIKNAIREIIKRDKVAQEDALFAGINAEERDTLEKVYPRVKTSSNGNGHH